MDLVFSLLYYLFFWLVCYLTLPLVIDTYNFDALVLTPLDA